MTRIACGCKINLGLKILGRRPDGFHNLQSVFYPLRWPADTIIVEKAPEPGLFVHCPGIPRVNTLTRAHACFGEATGYNPGVKLFMSKRVPMGAGLGGGSANAAAYLKWLNSICDNPLDNRQLARIAADVGADAPFFLGNAPGFVLGKGEIIKPVTFESRGWWLVVVNPGIEISTAVVFGAWDQRVEKASLTKTAHCANKTIPIGHTETIGISIADLSLENDLEEIVLAMYPDLSAIKTMLLKLGASEAAMSGSGSTFYGLFTAREAALAAAESLRQNWPRVYLEPMRDFGM